jgi:hypothetical protein
VALSRRCRRGVGYTWVAVLRLTHPGEIFGATVPVLSKSWRQTPFICYDVEGLEAERVVTPQEASSFPRHASPTL